MYILASTVVACLYTLYWAKEDRNTADTRVEIQYRVAVNTTDKQSTEKQDAGIKETEIHIAETEIESGSGVIQDPEIGREKTQDSEIQNTTKDTTQDTMIPNESNILRGGLDQPMTRIHLEVDDDDDDNDDEEYWDDFGWEKERTTVVSTTKVTIPPFLLEDIGGDWADDLQEEWEDGWQ